MTAREDGAVAGVVMRDHIKTGTVLPFAHDARKRTKRRASQRSKVLLGNENYVGVPHSD